MAILIKDMEMPDTCAQCDWICPDFAEMKYFCRRTGECLALPKARRGYNCPLEEVVTCGECKYVQLSLRDEVKYCDVFFPDKPHRLPKDHFCGLGEKE